MVHSSPSRLTAVEAKVHSGKFSASKKSADLRWPSRSALPVATLAALIVSLTHEAAGFAVSMWAVPCHSSNEPRTLVTIACRATKPSRLWLVSMV